MTHDVLIAPSILSADFARLGEEVRAVDAAGCDWVHVDVMDGHFVPNITIGPAGGGGASAPHTTLPLDVHLMIERPDRYIEAFAKAGADIITVHVEAGPHLRPHAAARSGASARRPACRSTPHTARGAIGYVLDGSTWCW